MRFKNGVDFNRIGLNNTFKINEAVKGAELFFSHNLDLIVKEDYFTHTKMTVIQVYDTLRLSTASVEIKTYKPKWRWSKAIAYVDGRNIIFLNEFKISQRSVADYINTLVHEYCHVAGFGHGNNSPKGKEHSVNYKVGQISEEWAIKNGKKIN